MDEEQSAPSLPELRAPVLVAAFEGWNDAGDAATAAVEHLEELWQAEPVAALDPDEYYDYQQTRPQIQIVDGIVRDLTWPTTRVSVVVLPDAGHDVVLVRGIEPNFRWRQFCEELLELAGELHVSQVIVLGALLADTPHTRPLPMTGSASDAETAARLGLATSQYEGPTGIVGVFSEAAQAAGLPTVGMWVAVPHYVAEPPCPKATLALLHHLEDYLEVSIPQGDLPAEARAWERGADEMARGDEEIAEYVRSLEDREAALDLPEASGEAIAREFERYLRRRGGS